MQYKTVVGFDFGTHCIGVAVGQSLTKTANPLTSILTVHGEPPWNKIQEILKEWLPEALIVGMPLNMNGSKQPMTLKAAAFGNKLSGFFNLPVYFIDERLTTVEAKSQIFTQKGYKGLKKSAIDSFSAKLIVEDWLNQN